MFVFLEKNPILEYKKLVADFLRFGENEINWNLSVSANRKI